MIYLALLLLSLVMSNQADAACTKGVNCFCDGKTALLCEDFDVPTLYSNTGFGNGSPYYGPFYDSTGGCCTNDRGANSYWKRKYGNGGTGHLWANGEPASPTLGSPCNVPGFEYCTGMKVWEAANLWTANALEPRIAFYTAASDFTAEDGTLTAPTNTHSGTAGIFDGNAMMAHRIPAGSPQAIHGGTTWTPTTHLGITYALAFPVNLDDSHLTFGGDNNWKFNEFVQVLNSNSGNDGLAGFGLAGVTATHAQFPAYGFIGSVESVDPFPGTVTCATVEASIVDTKGTHDCNAYYLTWYGDTSYQFPRDWPLGTWGCVRADIDFSTMSNGRVRLWLQTSVLTTETLVVDISGINGTGIANIASGWQGMLWNDYANANQGLGGSPSVERTFRYEDNWIVKNGTPETCAQIGFVAGGGSPSPRFSPKMRLKADSDGLATLVAD